MHNYFIFKFTNQNKEKNNLLSYLGLRFIFVIADYLQI